jgi:hypothetical protein
VPLGTREWSLVIPLILVPAIADEVTKAVTRLVERSRSVVAAA